jgi:hypothetical protein
MKIIITGAPVGGEARLARAGLSEVKRKVRGALRNEAGPQ